MRNRGFILFATWAVGAVLAAAQPAPNDVLVQLRPGPPSVITAAYTAAMQGSWQVSRQSGSFARISFPIGQSATQVAEVLSKLPGVAWAEPNYTVTAFDTPNDPQIVNQWAHAKIQTFESWVGLPNTESPIIAVIDTGVNRNHPDLVGRIGPGMDFIDFDQDPLDENGHGTHCAGTIAARSDNGIGIAGMVPNTQLMPVRVLDASGSGNVGDVADGIRWAVDHGAKVLSLSLGSEGNSQAMREAVTYAIERNVIVVAAAGNTGRNVPAYPAAIPQVVSVAATTAQDTRADFSNWGPSWVDVAAPGQNILSTEGDSYVVESGTSMATPHVAALAALVWTKLGDGATPAEVMERIEAHSDYVGEWVRTGRINAFRALHEDTAPAVRLESATEIAGGSLLRMRIVLGTAAPTGGTTVSVTSSDLSLIPTRSVVVRAGTRSAVVALRTYSVTADSDVVLTATTNDGTATSNVRLLSPQLAELRASRRTLASGRATTLRISLTSAAKGSLVVGLTSTPGTLEHPAQITFRRGERVRFVLIRAANVQATTPATLTATLNGRTDNCAIEVRPASQ